MTMVAKGTPVVHMITRTGKRQMFKDGSVVSDRSPEALLCGDEIIGATFNDAGRVVEHQPGQKQRVVKGAAMGTRLTDIRGDVTCPKCRRKLTKEVA